MGEADEVATRLVEAVAQQPLEIRSGCAVEEAERGGRRLSEARAARVILEAQRLGSLGRAAPPVREE